MSSMQAYLASKYMSGAKADAILARDDAGKPKKKKRKLEDGRAGSPSGSGIGIIDEDVTVLGQRRGQMKDDEEDTPLVTTEAASFASRTKNNWSSTGTSSSIPLPPRARSRSTSPVDLIDQASVYPLSPPVKRKGGLMTAAEVAIEAELQARLRAEAEAARARENAANPPENPVKDERETVYRNKTGAVIDVKAERAAAMQKEKDEKEKEAAKKEWGKGLVQKTEREKRVKLEQDMGRSRAVGRTRDDRALNEEQREAERWDDPAAGFLTKKTGKGPQKPKYSGPPAPPNRFNIAPGYRWDGVDRSTGFEDKLFQSMNTKRRVGVEAAAWSMEDM